jgi:hypothetical protein
LAQAFVKNIVATYIGRQTDCRGDILNPPSPGLMRRENNSVMSSTKNEAVVNHVKAQKTEMINISPQYVSELLTELVEEGVLRRNGRELIIVDQSGLWHEIDFEELILNH